MNALAPTALLSWTGRSAVGTTISLFVLLAIPDDLDGQVLAPRALCVYRDRPFQAHANEPHIGVAEFATRMRIIRNCGNFAVARHPALFMV